MDSKVLSVSVGSVDGDGDERWIGNDPVEIWGCAGGVGCGNSRARTRSRADTKWMGPRDTGRGSFRFHPFLLSSESASVFPSFSIVGRLGPSLSARESVTSHLSG